MMAETTENVGNVMDYSCRLAAILCPFLVAAVRQSAATHSHPFTFVPSQDLKVTFIGSGGTYVRNSCPKNTAIVQATAFQRQFANFLDIPTLFPRCTRGRFRRCEWHIDTTCSRTVQHQRAHHESSEKAQRKIMPSLAAMR